MRPHGWIGLLLIVATLVVYHKVRHHEFVGYDDQVYVVQNVMLRDGLSAAGIARAFRPYEDNWIPLTWISFQINYAFSALEPEGYLLTNVALHAASAVLLYLALAGMTGAPWRSAFVAAIFALHSLHVESVAWVTERKDTLSGLFWMLTLCAYAHYARKPGSLLRYLL